MYRNIILSDADLPFTWTFAPHANKSVWRTLPFDQINPWLHGILLQITVLLIQAILLATNGDEFVIEVHVPLLLTPHIVCLFKEFAPQLARVSSKNVLRVMQLVEMSV